MSVRGIELIADADVSREALKEQGYGFVVGSLGPAADGHLTAAAALDIIAAGLAIVSVYDGAKQASDGTPIGFDPLLFENPESLLHTLAYGNGETDGRNAHLAAKALGQPAGSAIYFEINADVTSGIVYVLDYFRGVAAGLAEAAGGEEAAYRIGVYGSGFVIDAVHDAGLAELKWLAAPAAWNGTAGYEAYDIRENGAEERADRTSESQPSFIVGQWTSPVTLPNLVINDLSVKSPPQPAGSTVGIGFAVGNAGTAAAAASKATLYLSTDETITAEDTVLGTFDVPSLATLSSAGGTLSWVIPADLAPGTYTIGIAVDPVAGEPSATDNAYAVSYTVAASPAGSPNLVIYDLALGKASVPAGGQQAISFEVGNVGASATVATSASLYLSTDATITSADTFLGSFAIPALAPLASVVRNLTATIPDGFADGTYYVGVVAGPVAGESNVNDNVFAVAFRVGEAPPAPNLVINDLVLDRAVAPAGGQVTIDVAVGNAGGAAAPASVATLYLSTDATISSADLEIGSFALAALAPGEATAGRIVASIPASIAEGFYHVGVLAGPVAGEPNVFDNVYAVGLEIAHVAGSVSISDATVLEGNSGVTFATFVVTRSGGTLPFSIGYATADGGATVADGDYEAASGTISFEANELVRTIAVAVNGDLADETLAPETFMVTLSGGTGGIVIAQGTGIATIIDDDEATQRPVVAAGDLRLHAGQAISAAAAIRSVSDAGDTAIAQYAFRDLAGGGFLRVAGVAQEGGSWVTVAAADLGSVAYVGGAVPGSEVIDIRVFDGTAWSEVAQATAETIADDSDDYGQTALTNGAIGIGQFVNGTIELPEDADWFAINLAAGERYRFDLEGVTTGAGTLGDPVLELRDGTGAVVQLGMHDDSDGATRARLVHTAAANDTYYLAARSADGGVGTYRLSAATRPLALVSIAAENAIRPEGRGGTTAFTFTVTRAGNVDVAATVDYAVTGSGAHPASAADFAGGALPSGSLSFLAGQTSQTLAIEVAGDTVAEENDGFSVTISSSSPDVAIGNEAAGGLIQDDDSFPDLTVVNSITGQRVAAAPRFYDGPVAGVDKEVILVTSENLNAAVSADNWFIRTGSGMDALTAHGGRNVLDGGAGSNFLTGASGADSFFLDARGAAADIWSTIVGFGREDSVTVWGISPETATLEWIDALGAEGFRGLTLQATAPGQPNALVTLAGFTRADLDAGLLQVTSGMAGGTDPYLYITTPT
jgi:hypothetical protein